MRNYLLFITIFIAIGLHSQNLITNGGFENDQAGWIKDSTTDYQTFFIDNTDFNSGTKSIRIILEEGDTASFGQFILADLNKKYRIEYSVKTQDVSTCLFPFVQFTKSDFTNVYSLYMTPAGDCEEWETNYGRINVHEESDYLVYLFVFNGSGTVWIDDVAIYEETNTEYTEYSVRINEIVDPIKNLFQSNGIDPANTDYPVFLQSFENLGINYVRTHDFAIAFDHGAIVGLEDQSYDPFDPSSYYFHISDSIAQNIYEAGGKIFYRFGQSYHYDTICSMPPADPQKWADVCVQIIKHYNEGWNNGYYYGLDYFEIWNEPDLPEFWKGSVQDYIEMYRCASKTIKLYNPELKVGGPALANVWDQSFINEFLDSVATYNLPLDFFSYHLYYLPNPYQFKLTNDYLRNKLDSYGLYDVELINTEWNTGHFNPAVYDPFSLDDAQNAAQVVSVLTYMQETDISLFFRYSFRNYWLGLVEENGDFRYSGLAYKAFHDLYNNGQRIYANGGDTLGKTIIATKSDTLMHILVSDNSSVSEGYNINFVDLSLDVDYLYTVYRIDENNIYEEYTNGVFNYSNPHISVLATPPFVDHIIVTPVDVSKLNDISQTDFTYLSPNPACDFVYLIFKQYHDNIQIRIYDISGKLLLTENYINSDKICISLRDIESGLYIINYDTENVSGNLKLIVK